MSPFRNFLTTHRWHDAGDARDAGVTGMIWVTRVTGGPKKEKEGEKKKEKEEIFATNKQTNNNKER